MQGTDGFTMTYQHWAMTNPFGPTPDKPHVLLRTEFGVDVKLWAPTEDDWLDGPGYFRAIYGDDPDCVQITEAQANQYTSEGVGHTAEGLAAVLRLNEQGDL